ncbi:transcriptional regulator [Marivita lacus]|uniref:Transcriptional regulator n=1 Tax=Marivita lacus TaxID=1323742 RepID=A0ABQ1LIS0_9RHOB|nr:transcriptional regulator [Marivita lacus]
MLTGPQIRCARAALGWSLADLAERSAVSLSTIRRAEAKIGVPEINLPNLEALKSTFEAAGIEFIGSPDDRPGIRIGTRKP